MKSALLIALRTTVVTLLLTGILYPLAVTGIGQAFFSRSARGSFVTDERGRVVGSDWIAQPFARPGYFQARPSAAGDKGFDPTSSSGSNLGPTSQKLRDRVIADAERLRGENPGAPGPLPAELLTASGSGLDPHLSPEAALWQVPRIAAARGIAQERVRNLILIETEPRTLGFLGEPRVNVLLLNLALDRQFGRAEKGSKASMN
ncbi:MAG TPA: potassium-transporting ATPase subunit KdpC [Myxococcaceae bacterium]|nr:potassium-transporting ATPase subunit KdpC [Myxococcaceae bacterium]